MPQTRYIRFSPKSIGILGWLIAAVFATLMLVAVAFVGVVALALGAGLLVLGAVLRMLRPWLPGYRAGQSADSGSSDAGRPASAQAGGEIIEAEYRVLKEVNRPASSSEEGSGGDGGRGDAP